MRSVSKGALHGFMTLYILWWFVVVYLFAFFEGTVRGGCILAFGGRFTGAFVVDLVWKE